MMDGTLDWMMGMGLLGWVLVVALLVTIVVILIQFLTRRDRKD